MRRMLAGVVAGALLVVAGKSSSLDVATISRNAGSRRVIWSTDGQRAAVIADDGLYMSSADGQLSPLLAPKVYGAAWLGDSQRLVLARARDVNNLSAPGRRARAR